MRRHLRLFLVLLCLLVATHGQRAAAQSDGVVRLDTHAGNYHVTVLTRPNPLAVGKVNALIRLGRLTETGSEYPVRGARVTLRFVALKTSAPVTQKNAVPAPETEPGNYETDDQIESDGRWRAEISIDQKEMGATQTSFDFDAIRPLGDELPFGIVVLGGFALAFITTIWFLARFWTRRQRAEEAVERS